MIHVFFFVNKSHRTKRSAGNSTVCFCETTTFCETNKQKKSLEVAKLGHESLECRRKYMQTHKITFKSDTNQTLAVF